MKGVSNLDFLAKLNSARSERLPARDIRRDFSRVVGVLITP